MAEYLANSEQAISLNAPVIFTASIPCTKGYVYHSDETGIFILRGITNNCFARYKVNFAANIAVPEGGAVTAISLAITENGEARPTSRAIFTPQAVNEYGVVSGVATITVPRGCCFSISIRYVDATTNDAAVDPTPVINVQNANVTIERIA